jgi:hypothetical protein
MGFNHQSLLLQHTNSEVKEKTTKKKKKKAKEEPEIPEEAARKILLDNKGLWERLCKRIATHTSIQQWKCYFRYCMFTIMTQSNRANYKHDSSKTERRWKHGVDLEKIWV